MGRKALFDREAVASLLTRQDGVITRGQASRCGMSEAALRHRLRDGGPWRVLLPGVYLSCTGAPAAAQRVIAASLYAGPGSVITGPAALVQHGVRAPQSDVVDVLVPQARTRSDVAFARVHRTWRMPERIYASGPVRYASPARAVADTARALSVLSDVRAVVAEAVQRRAVFLWQLAEELQVGPAQGSARLRQALAEVADGVRSAAEADLRTLVRREQLPDPMYNPCLYHGDTFIAKPDAWWPGAGVAAEVESREWHFSPRDWERTLARDARMSAQGIIVLHFPPRRLKAERRAVAAELRSAIRAGYSRKPLDIRAVAAG